MIHEKELKIVSLNIHKGISWFKKPILEKLSQQLQVLHPDIVLLQETQNLQYEVLAGETWPFFIYGKNAVYTKGHHGNAILSKFPILYSENINISQGFYEKRGLLYATIDLGFKKIHLLSVHLGLLRKARQKQLREIIKFISTKTMHSEPLIIGGDFNDWEQSASFPLTSELGLQEVFLHRHGRYARTYPAWAPFLCLDRIYSRGFIINDAQCLIHPSWKILSDHVAINASFKHVI